MSGKLNWKFDSGIKGKNPVRGVSYWTDGKEGRIFATVTSFLYALDAKTGKPVPSFGENGRIDLRGDYQAQAVAMTSPGMVYKDLIIVGGRNPETHPFPTRRHSRLRCAHGRSALAISHHSSSR